MEAYFLNYNLSWNLTPPLSCCCCYLLLVPWCFEPKKKSILYRDVANVNRYTTTKQHVGKYCRHPIGVCPRGNSCQQAQEKVEKREKIKASGITPYEHSELYNTLDTIVALEESSAEDGSFFQAEICFIFGRIFVYKEKFILRQVRKSLIHYAAWFLLKKRILHHWSFIFYPEHINSIFNLGFIKRSYLLFLWK